MKRVPPSEFLKTSLWYYLQIMRFGTLSGVVITAILLGMTYLITEPISAFFELDRNADMYLKLLFFIAVPIAAYWGYRRYEEYKVDKFVDEKSAQILGRVKLSLDENRPEILRSFEEIEEILGSCSDAEKISAGNSINLIWRMFSVKFGSVEDYQKLSDAEKGEFLQQMSDMQLHIIEEEQQGEAPPGSTHGACLVVSYIGAITADEGADVINYMAFTVEGYGLMAHNFMQSDS